MLYCDFFSLLDRGLGLLKRIRIHAHLPCYRGDELFEAAQVEAASSELFRLTRGRELLELVEVGGPEEPPRTYLHLSGPSDTFKIR